MPNQKNRQTAMMAAVLGAGLLGGTMLYAEPPRAPESTDRPASGTGHIRNTDLAGGFYDARSTTASVYAEYAPAFPANTTAQVSGLYHRQRFTIPAVRSETAPRRFSLYVS